MLLRSWLGIRIYPQSSQSALFDQAMPQSPPPSHPHRLCETGPPAKVPLRALIMDLTLSAANQMSPLPGDVPGQGNCPYHVSPDMCNGQTVESNLHQHYTVIHMLI